MRAGLVSWLIIVHQNLHLSSETLHITVNLVDGFCEKSIITRDQYQLLGITSLLIASKFMENLVPSLEALEKATNNTYTKEEIQEYEVKLLFEMHFGITFPTIYSFLQHFFELMGDRRQKVWHLACFLSELTLTQVEMNKWLPSRIACSCLYVACKMVSKSDQPWTSPMQNASNFSED